MEFITVLQYFLSIVILFRIIEWIFRLPHCGEVHRKYVLITGCDGGFGRHLAHRLDALGFRIFAGVRTEEGEYLVQQGTSSRVRPVRLDVRDPESVKASYRVVKANLAADGLWAVVNCAESVGAGGYTEWLQRKDYQECWDTNVAGVTDVTTTFLPLVKRVKGRVICTSSVAGRLGFIGGSPYSMAMHAVEAFSDSLRRQLNPFGVKVILMEPGLFKVNLLGARTARRNLWHTFRSAPDDVQKDYGEEFVQTLLRYDVDETLDMLTSTDIDVVMDGYEHALTALFPKKRYSLGKQAKYAFIPLSYLPSCIQDFFLSLRRPLPECVKRKLEQESSEEKKPTDVDKSDNNSKDEPVIDGETAKKHQADTLDMAGHKKTSAILDENSLPVETLATNESPVATRSIPLTTNRDKGGIKEPHTDESSEGHDQ